MGQQGPSEAKKMRIYKLGEPGSGSRNRGEIQDFYALREQCLKNGVLFEDPIFPAENSSLFYNSEGIPEYKIEWKRPREINSDPKLFVDGATRFDICQGTLGDCWFLSSVADITMKPDIFWRVVPKDQNFASDYAGIFHFRFWHYGRWIDVVVDDRLPVLYNSTQLLYTHSQTQKEFWSALLEKAYAKFHGCYQCLSGGTSNEALEDFTGGFGEQYRTKNAPKNLFTIMLKAYQRGSLIAAGTESGGERPDGLIGGHAYSVTALAEVNLLSTKLGGKVKLIRLRNPHGVGGAEWKGPWSDSSAEWKAVPEAKKKELGLVIGSDGEFWMRFQDFLQNFGNVDICHVHTPDTLGLDQDRTQNGYRWHMSAFDGAWREGVTSGGLLNGKGGLLPTFVKNPQYRITLEEPDDGDKEGNCTMIVALMLKDRRELHMMGGKEVSYSTIIFQLPYNDNIPKPLDLVSCYRLPRLDTIIGITNATEHVARYHVKPGSYIIVAGSVDPKLNGEYILRVFTEKKHRMEEYDTSQKVEVKAYKNITLTSADMFRKISGGQHEINWKQLKSVLDSQSGFPVKEFSKDICRSLIALSDVDLSGKMSLGEFKVLSGQLFTWKDAFLKHDVDKSGYLNLSELQAALSDAGINLGWRFLNILSTRYGDDGKISFDDFLLCAIKFTHGIDKFRKNQMNGLVTFDEPTWMLNIMYD